ncbi:unnamed protein product [Symbiodinium pilosum]|uniref:C3H1-type domain-containing protein n=1 Tax=Symbiodinium pilosum TaxID=2952 RepID=A0A812WT91_SYMPI|nr:unnamed protein product [Symbiodinium pilosum]
MFVIAFGLSGHILPRFVPSQCTSEQGMCTPGVCTCPFPLMKRDLVTQDALACSQCVEEFCPAVAGGASTCTESACACEDPSWPRIDVGPPGRPCWQCVRPHVDMTLRSSRADETCLRVIDDTDGVQLASSNSSSCTVFRFNGASILAKAHNNSCLTWTDSWSLVPCGLNATKFVQRTVSKEEAGRKDLFCVDRRKQLCLQAIEYMCTTDPAHCSMGTCRCEDSSHVRKEMQTANRSVCYVCAPPVPSCPVSLDSCITGPCECHDGLVKVHLGEDCYSCREETPPTGLAYCWSLASAVTQLVGCVALVVAIACAVRHAVVGGIGQVSASVRRRRNAAPRTWSEQWALYLQEVYEAVCEGTQDWQFLQFACGSVCHLLDMCDDALDPVYVFLENSLDAMQGGMATGFQAVCDGTRDWQSLQSACGSVCHLLDMCDDALVPVYVFLENGLDTLQGSVATVFQDLCGKRAVVDESKKRIRKGECQRQKATARRKTGQSDPGKDRGAHQDAEVHNASFKNAAAAAKAAQQSMQKPLEEDPPLDEAWIAAMERQEEKEKEANRERAAAQRRERTHAARARRARHGSEGAQEAKSDQMDSHLQASVAAETVDAESPEDDAAGGEAGDQQDDVPSREEATPEVLLATEGYGETEEAEEGWIKSSAAKMRGGRRRGERSTAGVSQTHSRAAVEPQAEEEGTVQMDLQPDEPEEVQGREPLERQTEPAETPQTAQDAPSALSKRQRQRLRQRQATEDARASGRKPERPEARAKMAAKPALDTTTSTDAPALEEAEEGATASTVASPGASSSDHVSADASKVLSSKALGPLEPQPSFADIVAGRPPRLSGDEPESLKATEELQFAVNAPDFVPLAAMTEMPFEGIVSLYPVQGVENNTGYWTQDMINGPVTFPFQWSCDPKCLSELSGKSSPDVDDQIQKVKLCVKVSCLPADTIPSCFINQLDAWGLGGTYDFVHVVKDGDVCMAFVNFIDPVFVMLFTCICQEYSFQGSITMADVQGLEALIAHWSNNNAQSKNCQPVIFPNARPNQWAVNTVNNMLLPHPLKDQFRKTKMCAYNKKKMCEMGPGCPYAHSRGELQPMPDLVKTKLCYNFFQRRCTDANCKFAHGSAELRSVWTQMPYGTWPIDEAGKWNPLGEEPPAVSRETATALWDVFVLFGTNFQDIQSAPWRSACTSRDKGDAVQSEAFSEEGRTRTSTRTSSLDEEGKVPLRVRNTFLEVMQVDTDDEEDVGKQPSMKRSFSDSHMETLREAMHEASDL